MRTLISICFVVVLFLHASMHQCEGAKTLNDVEIERRGGGGNPSPNQCGNVPSHGGRGHCSEGSVVLPPPAPSPQ